MNFFDTIFQAIVQGIAEFLPISSSGHLSVIQYFTGTGADEGFLLTVALHFGTLISIIVAFWPTIKELAIDFFRIILKIFTGNFSMIGKKGKEKMMLMLMLSLVPALIVVIFKDFFEGLASNGSIIEEGFCFLITAALLFLASRTIEGKTDEKSIRPSQAIGVGFMQILSAFPGVSRSGSVMSAGIFCGFKKELAVTYSFLLGIPAIVAAVLSQLLDLASGNQPMPSGGDIFTILCGIVVSATVGIFAIRFIKKLVLSNKFKYFAYYTFVLGVVVIILGLTGCFKAK